MSTYNLLRSAGLDMLFGPDRRAGPPRGRAGPQVPGPSCTPCHTPQGRDSAIASLDRLVGAIVRTCNLRRAENAAGVGCSRRPRPPPATPAAENAGGVGGGGVGGRALRAVSGGGAWISY
jgi:hypothetical protein